MTRAKVTKECQEIAVTGPAGTSFRARGTDLIALVTFLCVAMIAVVLWYQGEEQKRAALQVVEALKEVSETSAGLVKAQRFTSCILATDPEKRAEEYMRANSYCNRM